MTAGAIKQASDNASPYSPFVIDEIGDFLARDFPPRANILSPWLPHQGLAMIHARRGIGKTHLALGIAYAVASGGEFLRWRAEQPRGVLFLDGEMPAVVLQERLATIVETNAREPSAALRIFTPDLQECGMPDLSVVEDQKILQPHLAGVELIIVDNISTLCRSGRENEAESWLPVQEWALRMRAGGRSVLFIHHSGKGAAQRGTSKREDILDTVITLRHAADYKTADGAVFEVIFEKARGIYGDDVTPFEARLSTDASGVQCWYTQTLEESTFDKVLKLAKEDLKNGEIAVEIGIHKSNVSRHLKRAKGEGLLENTKNAG